MASNWTSDILQQFKEIICCGISMIPSVLRAKRAALLEMLYKQQRALFTLIIDFHGIAACNTFKSYLTQKHPSSPFQKLNQEQQIDFVQFCWVLVLIYLFSMELRKAEYALHTSHLLSVLTTPMCWQWEWLQQLNAQDSSGCSCGHSISFSYFPSLFPDSSQVVGEETPSFPFQTGSSTSCCVLSPEDSTVRTVLNTIL